jgi:catalase-peroxidase
MAYESMGLKTYGFAFGREDIWHPEKDVYWGAERNGSPPATTATPASTTPDDGEPAGRGADGPDLRQPRGRERPARPAPTAAQVRETFARMAMNDEETAALTAGGHTVGKTTATAREKPRARARGADDRGAGLRLAQPHARPRHRPRHRPSGLEGAWTTIPTKWDNGYFDLLFGYEWELTKSPAGRLAVGADRHPRGGHAGRRGGPPSAATR